MIMAHIICIAGQKGGTGKTTTAINLAASLALHEKQTLLIDCDPQGSATTGMGINKQAPLKDLYHVLTGAASIFKAILNSRLEFLKIIPARFKLIHIESKLVSLPGAETLLRHRLTPCLDRFDYIIIDTPASVGFFTRSALTASNQVLIPFQYQVFALEGLVQLLTIVQTIRHKTNPHLRISGILLTMCDVFSAMHSQINDDLPANLGQAVYDATIPFDRNLLDSANMALPLALMDLKAPGAKAYLNLALEIICKMPPTPAPGHGFQAQNR
jgi:chromosome partitioning protein